MGGGPVWLSGWGNVQGHFGFCRASTVYKPVWRRCSSVGQPNASSMLLTLEVFLNRLRTKRAARLWTASILAMFFCEYGSQTDAAYSNSGRTKTLYAFSLMLEALIFKLRLRKPRALFGAGVADVVVPTHRVVYCDAKVLS